ncbi:dTDP-4-dehydrorhamnose 3,5-epimerase [Magnetococcus marinus MC-1]|uniref:dTDP-4-dehydrorhamnose 3,5-epimerase n=1 Tax=Magnetococcus marinus (strain ATCC BAA-1437 / JCM 17883 / MC-1) TaxID=156889 RepID=A0LAF0_MAGMM|nr:dTDP-4-dehydrorhamnose 3,5-epimerase [Magnetococcus marinus]ABK44943.1 dTDP-4-dehydrorhamnose 3,5-epimerase [Magnetococcus marinus MC-1]
MRILESVLHGALVLQSTRFTDDRGFFTESYNHKKFSQLTGLKTHFVQDNHSRSKRHVLRGMHYQLRQPQAKLVQVCQGEVYDVIVDMRQSSPTFKQHFGLRLSADNGLALWVPEGFAHGFLVLSEQADLHYKVNNDYDPTSERCLHWADAEIGIAWPLSDQPPLLSPKDAQGLPFDQLELFP